MSSLAKEKLSSSPKSPSLPTRGHDMKDSGRRDFHASRLAPVVPPDFKCPISMEIMADPVVVASGETYERIYIERWLDDGNMVCPKTRKVLLHTKIIPNFTVKALITAWCEANNVPLPQPPRLDNLKSLNSHFLSRANPTQEEKMEQVRLFAEAAYAAAPHARPPLWAMMPPTTIPPAPPSLSASQLADRILAPSPRASSSSKPAEDREGSAHVPHDQSKGSLKSKHPKQVDVSFLPYPYPFQSQAENQSPSISGQSPDERGGAGNEQLRPLHSAPAALYPGTSGVNGTNGWPPLSTVGPLNSAGSPRPPPQLEVPFKNSGMGRDVWASEASQQHEALPADSPADTAVRSAFQRNSSKQNPDSEESRTQKVAGRAPNFSAPVGMIGQCFGEGKQHGRDSASQETASPFLRSPASVPRRSRDFEEDNSFDHVDIAALVQDLQHGNLELQRAAAEQVRAMTRNSSVNRDKVALAGAIEPLVKLLDCEDEGCVEQVVTALLNLSISDANKGPIASAGAVGPLVSVLNVGSDMARENAAATLFSLSVLDRNKLLIGEAGAIPPLAALLAKGSPRGQKDACTALFNLSISADNKGKIIAAGAVPKLVELAEPSLITTDKAVAVLANLATTVEGRAAIAEHQGIAALVEVIEAGTQRGKENASSALLHISTDNVQHRAMILQEGAIPPLVALSQTGTPRAKVKANALLKQFREQRQPPTVYHGKKA